MHTNESSKSDNKPIKESKSKLSNYVNLKTIVAFIAGIALTLLVFFGVNMITKSIQDSAIAIDYETILDLSEYLGDGNIDSSWSVVSADPSISNIMLEAGHGFEGRSAILHFHKTGANDFTFTNASGEVFTFTISIDSKKNISIIRR